MSRLTGVVRRAVRGCAGDVPARYWAVLFVLFVAGYAYYHANHRAYTGDGEYYTVMALLRAGYHYNDAMNAAGAYFHDPHIWRLDYGFFDPNFSLLIKPRVLYPILSAPFVWAVGPGGMWAVPVLAALFSIWGLMRLFTRLYDATLALAVLVVFMTTIAFWEFGTGIYVEPLCLALMVALLLNLPLKRSVRARNTVAVAVLTVALTLTRQMTPVVVAMLIVPYLGSVVRRRTWRTVWLAPTAAATVVGILAYYLTQLWAPYNAWPQFLATAGTKSKKEALLHLPRQAWRLLGAENASYLHSDLPMVLLWVVAILALLARFRTPQAALFLGAAASSVVFAVVDGTPSGLRYFFPMYPVLLLVVCDLVNGFVRRPAAPSDDGPPQPDVSEESLRTASESTSSRLQNANRTSGDPAATSS